MNHPKYRDPFDDPRNHRNHNNDDDDLSSPSSVFLLITAIFLAFILYHVLHTHFIRRKPLYYSVRDPEDPTIYHLRRLVPIPEWFRKVRKRPRSRSDLFRDEDFARVQAALDAQGWTGRVLSNGQPDLRSANNDGRGWGGDQNVNERDDVEYGPRQYVEREDTQFWRQSGRQYSTFSRTSSTAANTNINVNDNNIAIPHSNPAAIPHPETSIHSQPSVGSSHINEQSNIASSAALSYHPSPHGTHFATPPARVARDILQNHPILQGRIQQQGETQTQDLTFPTPELSSHYHRLCSDEKALRVELANSHSSETGTKLSHAIKQRLVFGERFSNEANGRQGMNLGENSNASRLDRIEDSGAEDGGEDQPPPYSEIDPKGVHRHR